MLFFNGPSSIPFFQSPQSIKVFASIGRETRYRKRPFKVKSSGIAAAVGFVAGVAGETIHGVTVFSRHGDRKFLISLAIKLGLTNWFYKEPQSII